jgi:hypothetical protein
VIEEVSGPINHKEYNVKRQASRPSIRVHPDILDTSIYISMYVDMKTFIIPTRMQNICDSTSSHSHCKPGPSKTANTLKPHESSARPSHRSAIPTLSFPTHPAQAAE